MTLQHIQQSRNYAKAFLNCFNDKLSLDDYHTCIKTAHFLKEHRSLLALLAIPILKKTTLLEAIKNLLKEYALPQEFDRLFTLLIDQKQLFLLPTIFEELIVLYRRRNNMEYFKIESSIPLSEDQITVIKNFLQNHTNKHILYDTEVTKELIAGIRLQSSTQLWDHSVAQRLRAIRTALGT